MLACRENLRLEGGSDQPEDTQPGDGKAGTGTLPLSAVLGCWDSPRRSPPHVLPPKHSAPAQAHLHIQPQRQHRTHRATTQENSKHASASPRSLPQEPPPGAHCPQMFTETPSKSHTHHPQIRMPCTNSTRIHTTHAAHIPSVSTCDGHTVYIYIYISHANAVVANIPPTLPTATLHVPYRQQRLRTPRLPNLHTRTGHGEQVSMLCVCGHAHTWTHVHTLMGARPRSRIARGSDFLRSRPHTSQVASTRLLSWGVKGRKGQGLGWTDCRGLPECRHYSQGDAGSSGPQEPGLGWGSRMQRAGSCLLRSGCPAPAPQPAPLSRPGSVGI